MEIFTPQNWQARKRQRRSPRPCDACRKRKTRCVTKEDEPNCVHCQLRNTACTFEHEPPRRSSTTAAIDDDSEDESIGAQNRRPRHARRSSPGGLQSAPRFQTPVSVSLDGGDQDLVLAEANSVSGALPPSQLSAEPTLGLAPSRFAELYGLGSDMEPILMVHRPYDRSTHEFSLETHSIRRVLEKDGGQEYPLTFHVASDDRALGGDPAHSQVDAVEECVRPHGPSLVELFWRHVQPCYPILAKEVFAQAYSQSYRNIPAALLGAVYLSSLRWWNYDPELSIRTLPDAAILRRILKTAIPSSYHRPKLSSIQAALLLLQCQPEDPLNPDHTYLWGLTCQALAIGQCLGLHLDATNWNIPQWERNLRKRLSWALYMHDRWTALAYGRPVHIHGDDWTVKDLTILDFNDDTSDDERGRSISATGRMQFMQMTEISQILSIVLSTFYTARASQGQDTVILYQAARPLFDMLENWYQNIPASLQMNITYQRKLCFHGYLHFSYYGVMMALLRRLIRSTALPPRCADDRVLSDIRQIALQTAQSAISFVTNLRPDHLEAFWYFTSPYLFSLLGSFTTLLLVTSLSSQERSFWQDTLNSYLWTLRTTSKSCEPMQYAVNRLEGAILRGLEHALAVNLNEPLDDNVSPMMAGFPNDVYEYTDFGDWDLAAGGTMAFDMLSAMAMQQNGLLPPDGL